MNLQKTQKRLLRTKIYKEKKELRLEINTLMKEKF